MSPTAKTPGAVVERPSGGTIASVAHGPGAPPGPSQASFGTSRPVRTKPCSSRRTADGSHPQVGRAPRSRNRPDAGTRSTSPVALVRRSTHSSRPPPPPSTTSVPTRTLTRSFHRSSSMRYCDIVSVRSRRTTMVTDDAKRDRCMAAWPAELPPPTTTTGWPSTSCAAVMAEP